MAEQKGRPENLDPVRAKEEARLRGASGGRRSGEVRRAKRDARQAAKRVLLMGAAGKLKDNLIDLGYDPASDDGILNIDVLVARLMVMGAAGNLQAGKELLKLAGYDSEENRAERESRAADRRKNRESEARLAALERGGVERYASSYTEGDGDGAVEDVFVYLPDNGRDSDLQVSGDIGNPGGGEADGEDSEASRGPAD